MQINLRFDASQQYRNYLIVPTVASDGQWTATIIEPGGGETLWATSTTHSTPMQAIEANKAVVDRDLKLLEEIK